jgi:hypothetical protein
MDLSGPSIDVKLKEKEKKERKDNREICKVTLPWGPSVTPIPYFNFKPRYSQSVFGLQGKDIVFRFMIEFSS